MRFCVVDNQCGHVLSSVVCRQYHLIMCVQVIELDSIAAVISGQSVHTQEVCASLMVANKFFFSAMKATSSSYLLLKKVLEDIKLQVIMHHL